MRQGHRTLPAEVQTQCDGTQDRATKPAWGSEGGGFPREVTAKARTKEKTAFPGVGEEKDGAAAGTQEPPACWGAGGALNGWQEAVRKEADSGLGGEARVLVSGRSFGKFCGSRITS